MNRMQNLWSRIWHQLQWIGFVVLYSLWIVCVVAGLFAIALMLLLVAALWLIWIQFDNT